MCRWLRRLEVGLRKEEKEKERKEKKAGGREEERGALSLRDELEEK